MSKKENLVRMIGESKDGQRYQVDLFCENGKENVTFINQIQKIGWDHYGYKLVNFEKIQTQTKNIK
jgi:hypothetical protein